MKTFSTLTRAYSGYALFLALVASFFIYPPDANAADSTVGSYWSTGGVTKVHTQLKFAAIGVGPRLYSFQGFARAEYLGRRSPFGTRGVRLQAHVNYDTAGLPRGATIEVRAFLSLSNTATALGICQLDASSPCTLPTACCASLLAPGASLPFPGHPFIAGPDPFDQFFPLPSGVFVEKVRFHIVPTYGGQAAGPPHNYTVRFHRPPRFAWRAYSCESPDEGCQPPLEKPCTARCCGGSVRNARGATVPEQCDEQGQAACARRHVSLHHTRFDTEAQQWHPCSQECCALCGNRTAYHQDTQPDGDWVFEDCSDYAAVWCDVGDRGGLVDAAWTAPRNDGTDQCVPPGEQLPTPTALPPTPIPTPTAVAGCLANDSCCVDPVNHCGVFALGPAETPSGSCLSGGYVAGR